MRRLENYRWQGNVRELRNLAENMYAREINKCVALDYREGQEAYQEQCDYISSRY